MHLEANLYHHPQYEAAYEKALTRLYSRGIESTGLQYILSVFDLDGTLVPPLATKLDTREIAFLKRIPPVLVATNRRSNNTQIFSQLSELSQLYIYQPSTSISKSIFSPGIKADGAQVRSFSEWLLGELPQILGIIVIGDSKKDEVFAHHLTQAISDFIKRPIPMEFSPVTSVANFLPPFLRSHTCF